MQHVTVNLRRLPRYECIKPMWPSWSECLEQVLYHHLLSQLQPKHTSITLSFAPGELSTLDYFSNIFAGPFYENPKPFNLSNLPCPPQSLLDAQNAANEIDFMLPARPGYAPIIAPPPAIQNLEPAWKWCHTQMAFDPPRSLVPAAILVPSPTPADQAGPQKTPAAPSPTLDSIPVQTQLSNQPASVYPLSKPNDPADPRVPPNDGPQSPNGNPNDPPGPSAPDPATGSQNGVDQGNPSTQPDPYLADPELSSNPFLDGKTESQPLLAAPVMTIGDQILTALDGGGYLIADTTIQPDAPAITVHGTPISLGSSVLVVGQSTLSLETGIANGVRIAAGIEYTQLDPARILLNGNTLSVNGPATIVSGSTVSLGSSGIVIAGQTFAFSTPAPEVVAPSTLTIAGQAIIQLGSSTVLVDGLALSVNGAGQTVHGTVLSLASSGIVINGQMYTLPTPAPDIVPGPDEVYTTSGQTVRLLGSSSAIIDGMLISVNGPAETVSGKTISLALSGIIVDGQSYPFPTLPLGPTSNAIVIDGTTLVAGGPAMAISGTTLSLASGNAGLYLTEIGPASSAFSVPVKAEASMTMDAAGKLVGVGSSDTLGGGVNGDGLGSLIMLGFGQSGATSASNVGGDATASNTAGNATSTAGLLAFTGAANKGHDLPVLVSFSVILCVWFLAAW